MPAKLLIKRLVNTQAPDDGSRWLRGEIVANVETTLVLQNGESPANGFLLSFTVTDRTVAQMQQYLDTYNRDIEYTLINAGPPRRYEVNNKNANTQGVGHWTVEAVDAIKVEWEIDHPAADITTIGFPNSGVNGLGNIWDMSGVFSLGEGAEFQAVVIERGINTMDRRTIWQVSEVFCANLEANGNQNSGTFSQLSPNLRDVRLD